MALSETMNLVAYDVSGQKKAVVEELASEATVEEVLHSLVREMGLPQKNPTGQEILYQALLEREGRHLNPSESVGRALLNGDTIVLHPNIDAGGR